MLEAASGQPQAQPAQDGQQSEGSLGRRSPAEGPADDEPRQDQPDREGAVEVEELERRLLVRGQHGLGRQRARAGLVELPDELAAEEGHGRQEGQERELDDSPEPRPAPPERREPHLDHGHRQSGAEAHSEAEERRRPVGPPVDAHLDDLDQQSGEEPERRPGEERAEHDLRDVVRRAAAHKEVLRRLAPFVPPAAPRGGPRPVDAIDSAP